MLEYPIMVWWIVGSILHDGSIKLLLVPASALYLVYQRLWYVLSSVGVVNIKDPLLLIEKSPLK